VPVAFLLLNFLPIDDDPILVLILDWPLASVRRDGGMIMIGDEVSL
jgi:hypothetical protein